MAWEGLFHSGLLEPMGFEMNTRDLILGVFDSATAALDAEHTKFTDLYQRETAKASTKDDDTEVGSLFQEMNWEEELYRQRGQGLGALALDWLMSELKGALLSAKTHLDLSHPSKRKYKYHRDWLRTVSSEYFQRFKIEFEKGPVAFGRIRELVFARNAGIHREDPKPLERYLNEIKTPAFTDDEDRFFVTREALVLMIQESERFLRWVVSEIEKLRPTKVQSN